MTNNQPVDGPLLNSVVLNFVSPLAVPSRMHTVVTLCSCFPWRDGARLRMVIRKCVVPAQKSSSSAILAVVPPTVLPNRVDLFGIDNDLCPCANCWFAHATVGDPRLM